MNTADIDLGLIKKFDAHLAQKGRSYTASVVGGAAIQLIANPARATGDIDSLTKIPDDIKAEIEAFAVQLGIEPSWFNDNASRNLNEFSTSQDELFETVIYRGEALTLYAPSKKVLLLSKFFPLLDRPGEAKDMDDIEDLIAAGAVSRDEFAEALDAFAWRIRFEETKTDKARARNLHGILSDLAKERFG